MQQEDQVNGVMRVSQARSRNDPAQMGGGIAPAPVVATPAAPATPATLATPAIAATPATPVQPAVMPNPVPYNPAARDVALRSLASAPAAAPSGVQTMGAPAAGAGVMAPDQKAQFISQFQAAQTPEEHQTAIDTLHNMMSQVAPTSQGPKERTMKLDNPDKSFGDHFDQMEKADKPAQAAKPMQTDDEAARQEALRIKKLRKGRLGANA